MICDIMSYVFEIDFDTFHQNLSLENNESFKMMNLKKQILDLANLEFANFQNIFSQEKMLFGENAEFVFIQKRNELRKSEIEYEIYKMKYYKMQFLYNNFMEE